MNQVTSGAMTQHASLPPGVTPNHDLLAVTNLVPGAELLGYGFNIFGSYDFVSATRPLLALGTPKDWTAPNGTVYDLPANVSAGGGSASASAYSFNSAQEFTAHFQGSAGVSGSYGAFSASFSTSYQSDQRNTQSYSWALVESKITSWVLNLAYGPGTVRPDVHSDPDFSNLPSQFDSTTAHLFFALFNKFGTHFISSIDVGGMLYYYLAISRQSSHSANDIRVSATAEYNALVTKVKVEADAQWSRTSANWTENRQSHAVTVPGVSNLVSWVSPGVGTYDSKGEFATWQTQVTNFPVRSAFRLTPISQLFSGPQAVAVQQAYIVYAGTRLFVQANITSDCNIIIGGKTIVPAGGYPVPVQSGDYVGGWQLVVLDRKTLAIRLNSFYALQFAGPLSWPDATCNQMVADLQPYMDAGKYVLIAATARIDAAANPNGALYGVLKSFGAGGQLDNWMTLEHGCSYGIGSSAYALIGVSGLPGAREGYVSSAISAPPTNSVTLDAFMQPQGDGSFLPVFPAG